jgi:hypothetical protein
MDPEEVSMVAALRISSPASNTARNVVGGRSAKERLARPEARRAPRRRLALPAWLCGTEGSARGYALDLSQGGARFGGVGTKLRPGDRLLAKIVLDEREAPVVLRAEVVRLALVAAAGRAACPEVCVRFIDSALEEQWRRPAAAAELARLEAFLERQRALEERAAGRPRSRRA